MRVLTHHCDHSCTYPYFSNFLDLCLLAYHTGHLFIVSTCIPRIITLISRVIVPETSLISQVVRFLIKVNVLIFIPTLLSYNIKLLRLGHNYASSADLFESLICNMSWPLSSSLFLYSTDISYVYLRSHTFASLVYHALLFLKTSSNRCMLFTNGFLIKLPQQTASTTFLVT